MKLTHAEIKVLTKILCQLIHADKGRVIDHLTKSELGLVGQISMKLFHYEKGLNYKPLTTEGGKEENEKLPVSLRK